MSASSVLKHSQKQNIGFTTLKFLEDHLLTFTKAKPTDGGGPHLTPRRTLREDMPPQRTSETHSNDASPMLSLDYLISPLNTILEPGNNINRGHAATIHDLIEAYAILSNRIRSGAEQLKREQTQLPALEPIKSSAIQFHECLKRDILRALVNPFADSRGNSSSPVPEEGVQQARDLALLSQHALLLLSDIFVFPALYNLFSVNQLQSILHESLTICTALNLPTPNAHKTQGLMIWMLKVQQLPSIVLDSEQRMISAALKRAIQEEIGAQQATLDAFKAIQNLLHRHPQYFFHALSDLLPAILTSVTSASVDTRFQAAEVLSGFALAKLHSPARSYRAAADAVSSYIEVQTSKRKSTQADNRLPSILADAISCEPSWGGRGPSWASVVLASLIVLSDFTLFTRPRSIKMFFNALTKLGGHNRAIIRALQPYVWKTLVWSYSRIPSYYDNEDDEDTPDIAEDTKERAFLVVRQELKSGIGISLAAALLLSRSESSQTLADVSETLKLAKDLVIGKGQAIRQDGRMLLGRLLSAIGVSSSPGTSTHNAVEHSFLFPRQLIDGTLLHISSIGEIDDVLQAMASSNVELVRPLSEAEIVHHWDDLLHIWVCGLETALKLADFPPSADFISIWQRLLLVQAHLTQERGHLTASPTFALQVASIVSGFIAQIEGSDSQARQLLLVKQLWTVMKNVFSVSWLPSPAEIILATILKNNFTLENESVKATWSQLCADLISVGVPTLLHILSVRSESQEEPEVTRHLWMFLIKDALREDIEGNWDNMVSLLTIPLGTWVLSDVETEMWLKTLSKALSVTDGLSIRKEDVIRKLMEHLSEEKLDSLRSMPDVVLGLLSHVDLRDTGRLEESLFSLVNGTLCSLYPSTPGKTSTPVRILLQLGEVIASTSPSVIPQLLLLTQEGLSCWIQDKSNMLSEAQYNTVVRNLYCKSLDLLSESEPSVETLEKFSKFFESGFTRVPIPNPAFGPIAFQNFWRYNYRQDDQMKGACPNNIRACLKAWSDLCNDSIADGLSLDSASQFTQPKSIILDSQPTEAVEYDSRAYDADASEHLDETVDTQARQDEDENHSLKDSSTTRSSRSLASSIVMSLRGHPQTKNALQDLQQYSSYLSDNNDSGSNFGKSLDDPHSLGLSTPHPTPEDRKESPSTEVFNGRKRTLEADHVRNSKRRKTELSDPLDNATGANNESMRVIDGSYRQRKERVTVSEPVTRASSILLPIEAASLPGGTRGKKPTSEPSMQMTRTSSHTPRPSTPSHEEYQSWEVGVSMEDVQLEPDLAADSAFFNDDGNTTFNDSQQTRIVLSPSLDVCVPSSSRRRDRSQTAPEAIPARPSSLRRNRTASARLDALEYAYAVMVDNDGVSHVPLQDLVQTAELVNKIGATLNEQMNKTVADFRNSA